jgi:hypothetical protein
MLSKMTERKRERERGREGEKYCMISVGCGMRRVKYIESENIEGVTRGESGEI